MHSYIDKAPRGFFFSFVGIVTVGQGLVKNFGGLVGLRLVLGIFEAWVFPGGTYLMSAYYARYELQWRFSLFLSSIIIAGAFGGVSLNLFAHPSFILQDDLCR